MAIGSGVYGIGLGITVVGWLLSPIIGLLLPKVLSYLGFDASQKLRELEIHTIPELKQTLRKVQEQRMLREAKGDASNIVTIDKLAGMLKHAQYEAEDILDLVGYHQMEKKHVAIDGELHGSSWLQRRLYGAVATCIDRCNIRSGSELLQWANKSLGWFLRRSDDTLPVSATPADEPVPVTSAAPSDSSGQWLCSFDFIINCCRSVLNWLVDAIEVARYYRNWSYEVVGITSYQENAAAASDSVLPAISRWDLKKRIEKVESTISEVKKSPLLDVESKSALNDIVNMNRRKIRSSSSKREVFGREVLRDDIMAKLRETPHVDAPSSSNSTCYSVIGIYGVAGSGKTTLARYVLDYIKEDKDKLFNTIMCIHVSETFCVDDIFHDMLKDITGDRHSNISCREELEKTLEEKLRGKRFFLVLDDLWVKDINYQKLKELLSPLNVGMKGSKILATARREDAVRALGADEPIAISNLDEEQYFSMFMHYALGGTSVADENFISVGREIAKKLRGSAIAAVTVAGRLGTNPNISFWEVTARLDVLNGTRGALWWSYMQLDVDIRRCFEFCNIFPRRFKLRREELVRMWIAQGFVKASCATEAMEDVAENYVQELLSCSFLQPEGTTVDTDYFTIHDLLHDLADKIAGSDCFRIENGWSQRGEGWKGDVPRHVRHLFVQNYDGELITDKILALENLNLRTLIIYTVGWDTPVEKKVIESIFKRLRKLRVLAVALNQKIRALIKKPEKLSVPESISQLKHLRYLAFRTSTSCRVILPSTLTKLYHIQLLDFGDCKELEFSSGDLIKMRHVSSYSGPNFSDIGRLTSLETLLDFTVRKEKGYEIKQLRDLNKLRGSLHICGLGNVKSKEEALEANLAAKERLTELSLSWDGDTRCSLDIEAEVIEGLCPPMGIETLTIYDYEGSRYPNWMLGKQDAGPKDLQELWFDGCSQLGPAPRVEAFIHLRVLTVCDCSWDALPGNMEHLTSLKRLLIYKCLNIRSLPTLPPSLEKFTLIHCNYEFMKSCQTVGHPNWQKIEHIPEMKWTLVDGKPVTPLAAFPLQCITKARGGSDPNPNNRKKEKRS